MVDARWIQGSFILGEKMEEPKTKLQEDFEEALNVAKEHLSDEIACRTCELCGVPFDKMEREEIERHLRNAIRTRKISGRRADQLAARVKELEVVNRGLKSENAKLNKECQDHCLTILRLRNENSMMGKSPFDIGVMIERYVDAYLKLKEKIPS